MLLELLTDKVVRVFAYNDKNIERTNPHSFWPNSCIKGLKSISAKLILSTESKNLKKSSCYEPRSAGRCLKA